MEKAGLADNKVIIVGLDGATLQLIEPWAKEGKLPNFSKFFVNGAYGRLESTLPPHTPIAWTSFMTGANAGKHGIVDFLTREKTSYKSVPINATYRRAKPIWTLVSEMGLKPIVINVPITYPPDKVNGVLISGLNTPETAVHYMHPANLHSELEGLFGKYQIEPPFFPRDQIFSQAFLDELAKLIKLRSDVFFHLMEKHPWDLNVVVFVAPDRVQHYFWKSMDMNHPDYDPAIDKQFESAIFDVYAQMDAFLGKLIEKIGDQAHIIIMSDHGAGPCHKCVDINEWLRAKSYLVLKNNVRLRKRRMIGKMRKLAAAIGMSEWLKKKSQLFIQKDPRSQQIRDLHGLVDWSKTKAYALGVLGNICINLQGREPEGVVPAGQAYQETLTMISDDLRALRDPETNESVIKEVFRKDEIFSGDCSPDLPDLIITCNDGYRSAGISARLGLSTDSEFVLQRDFWSGYHRMDGTLMLFGPRIKKGLRIEGASIMDIAPTALYLLGLPVPKEMDGQVLTSAIDKDYLLEHPPKLAETHTIDTDEAAKMVDLSAEETETIEQRLRSLGYME